MARVPTYDSPQVQPQALPGARIEEAPVGLAADITARQGAQIQQAGNQLVDTTHRIGMDMLEQANQLRVDDAVNQAKEQALRLTFDKDAGFTNLKGQAALQRPNGQSLGDEYGGNLQTGFSDIAAGLGNDRQRQLFQQRTQPVLQQFQAQLMQHENQEFKTYATSVREGTIQNQMNAIGLNYNNPAVVDDAVKSIYASTYDLARLNGRSAEWAEAQARKMASNGHLVAIQSALEKNDPIYADQYLKKYAGSMDANDILRANGIITKEVDAKIGQAAATQVMLSNQYKMAPTDADRLSNLVAANGIDFARLDAAKVQAESGGRRYGANGKLLESDKGAKGEHQVVDSTNLDPGYGVTPAKDNSPEERARVGRDYLQAMLQKYRGNVAQALAGYNAGPGNTDAAIREANKNGTPAQWMNYLPKPSETIPYVNRVLASYNAGGGAPARPTLQDVHQQVRETLGPNARPEQLRIATEQATKLYSDQTAAIKQREEEAVAAAQTALIQNGGNFAALPPSVRAAIPPGKFDDVMGFAGKLSAGVPTHTNWDLYYSLKRDPQVLGKVNLGALRDKLGDAEFKQLVNEQQDIQQGETEDMTRLRNGKDILNQMMREAGIDPTPKDTDKDGAATVGRLWNAFEQRVREREQVTGKKLSPEEMKPIAAQLFTAVEVDRPWLWNKSASAGTVTPGQKLVVPPGEAKLITDALKARGLPATDDAIQNLYRRKLGVAPTANNG